MQSNRRIRGEVRSLDGKGMKRFLLLALFVSVEISASAQVYKVRQWTPLMGTRGWPIYLEAGQVTILDTLGSARAATLDRFTREEIAYISGLQLPNRATFEQALLQGDAVEAELDKADEAESKRIAALKAAQAARDVRSSGTIMSQTSMNTYYFDVITESHAAERREAYRQAHSMKLLSKDQLVYAAALLKNTRNGSKQKRSNPSRFATRRQEPCNSPFLLLAGL